MGLKKLVAKVAAYNARLEDGKASKINASDVQTVLDKLRAKAAEIEAEIAASKNADKTVRLEHKLGIAREQIARAEWLLSEVA